MSKAFTKEDGPESETEPDEEDRELKSAGSRNYMTPASAARLRAELKRLLEVDRPEVVRTVSWAASNGDRSENGDYIYGKRRLREIDRRLRFLQRRLDAAEIIDPAQVKSEQVLFGCTVTVADEDGKRRTYSIVGIDESDPGRGRVSWVSPIAKALLGHRVGEVVTFKSPKAPVEGEELEIVSVRYVEIAD